MRGCCNIIKLQDVCGASLSIKFPMISFADRNEEEICTLNATSNKILMKKSPCKVWVITTEKLPCII